jgi:AraC family transcriptional regulator
MAQRLHDSNAAATRGLDFCGPSASDAVPRYVESDIIAPVRTIGLDTASTLKATFWHCSVEETEQLGDTEFVSIALSTGGGRIWRNNEKTANVPGGISMMPFEGARWHFETRCSFVQLYLPFKLVGSVSESLFDRGLSPGDLRMPSAVREGDLCRTAHAVSGSLVSLEPTNLILDSWALILADIMVRSLSRHAGRQERKAFGKIPVRAVAGVIDYIEAHIDRDLDLSSLAGVAGMSTYHFAHRFKETLGVSPHAYVLARRVGRARGMLRQNEVALSQVALACGFSSQAHFTTAFLRHVGMTPGQYRRGALL